MKEDRQSSMEPGENHVEVQKSGGVSSRRKNSYRVLKMAVFILFLAGFGFLAVKFISTFYIYSTVLNIKPERIQQFPTPALTYCSKYTLKFDQYCANYEDRCIRNSSTNVIEENHKHYDLSIKKLNRAFGKPSKTPKKLPGFFENQPFLKTLYFNTDKAIEVKKIQNSNEPFGQKFLFYDTFNSVLQICYGYGYGPKWDGDLRNMTVRNYEKRVKWADFSLSFKQAENVYLEPQPYGTLYIHSPFHSFKTFEKKITVKPTNNYHIHISLQEERLLPAPYDTDCTDYVSLWKKNEGNAPLSRDMCQHECLLGPRYFKNTDEGLISAGFCYSLMKAPKERRENDTIWKNCKCFIECKEDCLVLNYDFTYQEKPNIDRRYPYAYVLIYIKDNKVQISTHKPHYMDIERLSYVGGFLGLCLGILIWAKKGFLRKMFYGAVTKTRDCTKSPSQKPTPLEEVSEEDDKAKEIP